MIKNITVIFITAIIALANTGCKKSNNSTSGNNGTPSFKADTAFILVQANAFPNYVAWHSIAMDTAGSKIFFYYPNIADGFRIDLFDISSGITSTIYKHFSQSGQKTWNTSNGSEAMRLRYFINTFDGNKLIVPGGATNLFIIEIKVNSDYSTTFQKLDTLPLTSNTFRVEDAYDADLVKTAASNQISVVSMWDCVYNINNDYPTYPVSKTRHGSSIVGTPGGLEYIFCGYSLTLELYNNGSFIRGISMPYQESQLQMDSKKRIYAYNGSSIFRFSPDLLTKEEFPVKGTLAGYRNCAMVIKEMANWVQVYSFNGKDLIGMRLPL